MTKKGLEDFVNGNCLMRDCLNDNLFYCDEITSNGIMKIIEYNTGLKDEVYFWKNKLREVRYEEIY